MAGLCGVRHHSLVLAGHPPARRLLALAAALTLSSSATAMGRHGAGAGRNHIILANSVAIPDAMDLAARSCSVGCCMVDLLVFRSRLQPSPTRRPSRGHLRTSGKGAGDLRHPGSHPPSHLSGTLVRHDGLEYRLGLDGLLWADGVCRSLGRDDDPPRRQGTGAEVWRSLPAVPAEGARRSAQDLRPDRATLSCPGLAEGESNPSSLRATRFLGCHRYNRNQLKPAAERFFRTLRTGGGGAASEPRAARICG
jgi:hypothetical protein